MLGQKAPSLAAVKTTAVAVPIRLLIDGDRSVQDGDTVHLKYFFQQLRLVMQQVYQIGGIKNRRIKPAASLVILPGTAGAEIHFDIASQPVIMKNQLYFCFHL